MGDLLTPATSPFCWSVLHDLDVIVFALSCLYFILLLVFFNQWMNENPAIRVKVNNSTVNYNCCERENPFSPRQQHWVYQHSRAGLTHIQKWLNNIKWAQQHFYVLLFSFFMFFLVLRSFFFFFPLFGCDFVFLIVKGLLLMLGLCERP